MKPVVDFYRPSLKGDESQAMAEVFRGSLHGGLDFTRRCQDWLRDYTGAAGVFLTNSGTAALEMACLLADLREGDEVIMPSFTFSSTANAVVLRGAVPVFVDVRPDTLNLDENLVARAVTRKTKAIMPVHYAGVACAMDALMKMGRDAKLLVIEDAAQAIMARHEERPLGSIGDFGAFSFHGSKNLSCGEGGALVIRDRRWVRRAEILWEKGTDRQRLLRGEVDKYTWRDVGSSFLPSDLTAALLWTQLRRAGAITRARVKLWRRYHARLEPLERAGKLARPTLPEACTTNGHIYYILLSSRTRRDQVIKELRARGIPAYFHYVPLHSAPAGKRFGRVAGAMAVTDRVAGCLLRLPLHAELGIEGQDKVISALADVLGRS